MTDTENDLRLPDEWAEEVWRRSGSHAGKPFELKPAGPERVRDFLKAKEDQLRDSLARPENADIAAPALRHLDGEHDPDGAGYLAAYYNGTDRSRESSILRPHLDAWIIEHGLAFAVRAALARLSVGIDDHSWVRASKIRRTTVYKATTYNFAGYHWEVIGAIADLRSVLADATEADRDAAVAAAAERRTTHVERLIAALVFPDQRDWLEAVIREYEDWDDSEIEQLLWLVVDDPALLRAVKLSTIKSWHISHRTLAAILQNLGPGALPFLAATLARGQVAPRDRGLLLAAIGIVPSDEAAAYVVGRAAEPGAFRIAADTVERYPRRGLRVIAARAATAPPETRPRLAALARRVPVRHRDALPDATRAAIEALTAPSETPLADPADLPALLVAPPWTIKRPKVKAVVIEGLQAPVETTMRWAAGEADEWAHFAPNYHSRTKESRWRQLLEPGHRAQRHYPVVATYAPEHLAQEALESWDGTFDRYSQGVLKVILARFGPQAADKILTALRANPNHHAALLPIHSVAAARLAADWFMRLKGARASATAWFERHGADGAGLLVPDALGSDKKLRRNAENALAYAASLHGDAAITAAAGPYGPEAVAAVAAVLDTDPLLPRGVKIPKPESRWAEPELLPEVLLADRTRALPPESVQHLITVLALATPDYPYAGLDVVAEACDAASLAGFSRALFQCWNADAFGSKDAWALTQLAHFGDDDTVRLLAPLVREWPGLSQHKRAVNGLEVLGIIGSEAALRAIQGIAEKVKFKALKQEAAQQIQVIAEGLGLTRDQLSDRLLPDFGLGEDGTTVLDYGPRKFKVAFDEHLKPFVTDEDGKPRKALPKPGAKDDPELAEAAYKRFALLKKELRTVAADQVQRLEAAMVNGRTWTKDEFERYYVRHPLTWHLTRRLVWSAETGGASAAFRVAEDRTYTDANDDAFTLPDGAVIRLDHPVRLGDKATEWAELFADYEILQPFDQLGRLVMAFTDEELATGRLARFEGAEVEVGRILGLTKRGWHRAAPEDGGVEPGIHFPLPGGGHVVVGLEPGIWVGMVGENPEQVLQSVRLRSTEDYWWSGRGEPEPDHPKDIDPVTASEVLAALWHLTAKD
jgi:hypothetical protein